MRVRTEGGYEVWETPSGEYLVVSPFGQVLCPTVDCAMHELDARTVAIRVVASSARRLAVAERSGRVPAVLARRN